MMRRNLTLVTCVTLCGLCLAAPCWAHQPVAESSDGVTLVDIDGTEQHLSIEELAAMPQELEEECIVVGSHVGFIGIFDYTGVRLAEILRRAKTLKQCTDYVKRNVYLVFRGTDDYQVLATLPELKGTEAGKRAMILLEKDGEPLPETEGRIRLYFPGDKYCGRSVMALERIELHVAEGVPVEKKKDKSDDANDNGDGAGGVDQSVGDKGHH